MCRVLILAVAFLALAVAPSASALAWTQEGSPPASPATGVTELTIDIAGRGLHLACAGSGEPPILLESGGPNPEGDTAFVAAAGPDLSTVLGTRFCGYDRAGTGQSDPHPMGVRTLAEAADDLRAVLASPELGCPC